MVKVLAFDSAGRGCSAAVLLDGRLAARRFALMERGQAEALLPMIAAVLDEAAAEKGGAPLAALDLIAVTVGPGAFTGLRIGLAAARGLALASGLPVAGVTTFAAVAAAVPEELCAGRTLVVAVDSKRAEFFLQAFASGAGAARHPLEDGALVAPGEVAAWVPPGPLLLAGDAAPRLAELLAHGPPDRPVTLAPGPGVPDAAEVARLAAASWQPGTAPPPPRPLYLRAPDTTAPRPERYPGRAKPRAAGR